MVHVECDRGDASTETVTDSLGNSFNLDLSTTAAQTIGGSAILHAFSIAGGVDTVTPALCAGTMSFSVETYNGILGLGALGKDARIITTDASCNTGPTTTCLSSVTINVQSTSILYEALDVYSNNDGAQGPLFTMGSSQTTRQTFSLHTGAGNARDAGFSADKTLTQGGNQALSATWLEGVGGGFSDGVAHLVVELQITSSFLGSVTNCYGNCGNPPITLGNDNSTRTFAFNQSITIFYEFQSTLNGYILNVTSNLAHSYSNGETPYLAVYLVNNCPSNQTPFSPTCPGTQILGGPINTQAKGRFSLQGGVRYPVNNGQWVAVALSGLFSGLDVNGTNVNKTLMQTTEGRIPTTISNPSVVASSDVGLWGFIQGNTITGVPPPAVNPGGSCGSMDCVFASLTSGFCSVVTVSCQSSAGIFWVLMISIITLVVAGVGLNTAAPGARIPWGNFFGLILICWLFVFAGLNLISSVFYVVIFVIVALMFQKDIRSYL